MFITLNQCCFNTKHVTNIMIAGYDSDYYKIQLCFANEKEKVNIYRDLELKDALKIVEVLRKHFNLIEYGYDLKSEYIDHENWKNFAAHLKSLHAEIKKIVDGDSEDDEE